MAAGRPAFYTDEDELRNAIQEYFNSCVPTFDDDGNITSLNNPTVSGLAYALGFESRQSMYDYEKREQFSYIIKRARLFVEMNYEQNLCNPQIKATGPIFALKNMGWFDKAPDINGDNSDKLAQVIRDVMAE